MGTGAGLTQPRYTVLAAYTPSVCPHPHPTTHPHTPSLPFPPSIVQLLIEQSFVWDSKMEIKLLVTLLGNAMQLAKAGGSASGGAWAALQSLLSRASRVRVGAGQGRCLHRAVWARAAAADANEGGCTLFA